MVGLNMKAVCRLTGLNSSTLRAWERRYEAIKPMRTDSGHRLYSYQDVERLGLLVRLSAQGYSISNLALLADVKLRTLVEKEEPLRPQEMATPPNRSSALLEELLAELVRFNLKAIAPLMTKIRNLYSVRVFVLDFVSPLLGEVGRRVADGSLSIAQEHALSAILRAQLGQMMQEMNFSTKRKENLPNFVFSTAEGELHEFGILLSTLLCGAWGLNFQYLGPNLPAIALANATEALDGSHIVLGISPFTKNIGAYIKELDQGLKKHVCEIVVGGPSKQDFSKVTGGRPCRGVATLQEMDVLFERLAPPAN